MSDRVTGQCYCGQIKFEITLPTNFCSHCHCESCRRSHGSALVTWTGVPISQFRFISGQDKLKKYESSPGVRWGFCSDCGTSLLYDSDASKDNIYMTLANLNSVIDREPEGHVSFEEHVPWLTVNDGLPRYREKSSEQI